MTDKNIDVEPTAGVIDDMAMTMRRVAEEMESISLALRRSGDLSLAGDAIYAASTMILTFRLDLLARRPCAEYQRALHEKEREESND